jgi:hypothetical protein
MSLDPKTWEPLFERLNREHPPIDAAAFRRLTRLVSRERRQVSAKQDGAVPQDFLSIAELARRWRCSRGTVYNRLRTAGAQVLDFAPRGKRGRKAVSLKTVLGIENQQTKRLR